MKNVKLSKNCYVPQENISLLTAYNTEPVRREVRTKRKENNVIDLTSGKKILSAVYLKNGQIILLNTSIDTLNERMEGGE